MKMPTITEDTFQLNKMIDSKKKGGKQKDERMGENVEKRHEQSQKKKEEVPEGRAQTEQ